jgi:hypothetical protein
MIILLAVIVAIIAVPTVAEAIAHPKENLLRSTGQAIDETVVKPIEEAVFRPVGLYFEKMIAEIEDQTLRALIRWVFSWFTNIFKVIRDIFKS